MNTLKNKKILIFSCGLFIFLFSFSLYLNSIHNGFLAGDDEDIILRNNYLKDPRDFPKFFTENFKAGSGVITNYYRPFQMLTYGLITKTIGIKPEPFHLDSILFHSLCALLLFLVFRKLLYPEISLPVIVLGTLLWASLPIHNEEVAGITGLGSPSYLFWMLMSMLAFLNFGNGARLRWYIASLASFILALLSKESAIVLPGLLLGMHLTCISSAKLRKIKLKEAFILHAPFWLIALLYIYLRLTLLNFENTLNFYNSSNIFTQNLSFRIYTFFTVFARGLKIIFIPVGIHPEKSWQVFTSFFSAPVWSSFLVIILLIALAIAFRKKNPVFSFGVFWFFFSYLPMSNIGAAINSLTCDHWFYAPSAGILLALLSLLRNKPARRVACLLLVAGVAIFSVITVSRNKYWKDTETLSRFILKYEPDSAKTWNNLAIALAEKGDYEGAIEGYSKAIALLDTYPQSHHNLANAYVNIRKYALAEEEYLKAIAMDSNFFYSYEALGKLYLAQGKKAEALDYFRKALEIYPELREARGLLRKLQEGIYP